MLGSGVMLQNNTAYSYVRINASAIAIVTSDVFTGLPALNVGQEGRNVNENNLTVEITYTGSTFGSSSSSISRGSPRTWFRVEFLPNGYRGQFFAIYRCTSAL